MKKVDSFSESTIRKTFEMTTREAVLSYGLSLPDTYQDAPFHDENWQLVRIRKK